jgi:dTDP-4-amino-4,6-dideoxygalactose transaminase
VIKVARACMGDEEMTQVREAFDYGYFGLAYKVSEFEKEIGEYLGAQNVVAVNTGTSALHLALDCLGIGAGDEVIVPSLTFVASFQAIAATGATPVACEIDPHTLLLDIADAERRITAKTKAIMPMHYGGSPCDMDALLALRAKYGVRIVEDAAHAFGSCYRGRKIGSFGDVTCLSFDSIKVITCGEGGAIIFRDDDLTALARQKRLLGIKRESYSTDWRERGWRYEVTTNGYRYHMSNINAAIGLAQLKKIGAFIARRRQICEMYDAELKGIPWLQCRQADYPAIAPFIYIVLVKNGARNELMAYLKGRQIETGVNYIPNHLQPQFRGTAASLPLTEKVFAENLTLPLHCGLTDIEVKEIIAAVRNFR